jgi:predicted nucleotidyltransferase
VTDGESGWGRNRPLSRFAARNYASRFADALATTLRGRLIAVLMYGSWSRGEGRPGASDVDIAIIVDAVDDGIHQSMRRAWDAARFGSASVFGLDELSAVPRDGVSIYLSPHNSELIYGVNPLGEPDELDFARDLAVKAYHLAHEARCALYYPWLSVEGRRRRLRYALRKYLMWGAMNWVALRRGALPTEVRQLPMELSGSNVVGEKVLELLSVDVDTATETELYGIAVTLNEVARAWFKEIIDSWAISEPSD